MNDIWDEQARIDGDLLRVSGNGSARWFVCNGQEDLDQTWHTGGPHAATVRTRQGSLVSGLVVSRYEGGRLVDLLRARGPLNPAQTRTVLHDAVNVFLAAPPPPAGRTRIDSRALALDAAGCLVAVPGLHVQAGEAETDSQSLARLAFATLTGDPDMRLGTPPGALVSGLGEATASLLADLATGEGVSATDLLARIEACGAREPIPFYPAEPGVSIAAAATADLPVVEESGSGGPTAVAELRRGAAGKSEGLPHSNSRARARPVRRLWWLLGAAACVIAGGLLVVPGLGATGDRDTKPTAAVGAQGSVSAPAAEGDPTPRRAAVLRDRKDPGGAWVELTRLREVAYETGNAALLLKLSAADSPAARSEDVATLREYRGKDVSLRLSEVTVRRLAGERATVVSLQHTSAGGPAGMIDYGEVRLLAELVYTKSGWVAHRVVQAA